MTNSFAPDLLPDEVHVWQTELDRTVVEVHDFFSLLSDNEKARADRYRFPKDRCRFISGRGQLRRLLAHYTEMSPEIIRFVVGSKGKPALASERNPLALEFNLSHSGNLALYAFSRSRPVGIDVEALHPERDIEKIADEFYTPREAASIKELPEPERLLAFFTCWTRKEAYLKAHGEGLGFGLDRFEVSPLPNAATILLATPFDPAETLRWKFLPLKVPTGFAAACAVRAEDDRSITLRQFTLP